MNIQCDDAVVERLLRTIRDEVEQAGAKLHPALVIRQRGSEMWAACATPAQPEAPLIHLPAEVLIPIDDLQWDASRDLTPVRGLERLTDSQRRLLDKLLALYEATDKIEHSRPRLPALALRDWPELVAYLARARPIWGERHAAPGATQAFLKTREFPLPTETAGERRRCLIPLIDAFNHHPSGAAYSHRAGGMAIAARRPGPTDECFACYGFRDAMALLLGLGYVDTQPGFVQSVACAVDLGESGRLRIAGQHGRKEPSDDLPALEFGADGEVAISHFTLDPGGVKRWRIFLDLLLRRVDPGLPASIREARVAAVYESIRATNADYYAGLLDLVRDRNLDRQAPIMADMLNRVARHQLTILDSLATG